MEIKKILIIRFRRVGDSVLSSVLCSRLREAFPYAQIDYVLNKNIASLYYKHPDIDNLITFDEQENHNLWQYLLKVRMVTKKNHYDVIIDTRSTIKTLLFSIFSFHSPYRIGRKKKYNVFIHNYRFDNYNSLLNNDMVERNLMLLSPLEHEAIIKYDSNFKLYVTEKEKEDFRILMKQRGIDFERPVILAAVITRLDHKAWDKKNMKEILIRIINKYNAQIIFNFGDAEEGSALTFHHEMDNNESIFTNIRAHSLRDLCAMTFNCNFFFGNEGGPRHIAQALSIPSYAIYPPGISKTIWLPGANDRYQGISPDDKYTQKQQQRLNYSERFNLITVEDVWEGVDHMLTDYLKKTST